MSKKHHPEKTGQKELFVDKGGNLKVSNKEAARPGVRCFHGHLPLLMGKGRLYGGNCSTPIFQKADIYVGLDWNMQRKSGGEYPWQPKVPGPIEIHFKINDGSPPADKAEFKHMIEWLAGQLNDGKNVHVGCIGGHGRTGMVLAALVKVVLGIDDAITYVRKGYCQKAVESTSQVQFLNKEFGITEVQGSRNTSAYQGTGTGFTKFMGDVKGGVGYGGGTGGYTGGYGGHSSYHPQGPSGHNHRSSYSSSSTLTTPQYGGPGAASVMAPQYIRSACGPNSIWGY